VPAFNRAWGRLVQTASHLELPPRSANWVKSPGFGRRSWPPSCSSRRGLAPRREAVGRRRQPLWRGSARSAGGPPGQSLFGSFEVQQHDHGPARESRRVCPGCRTVVAGPPHVAGDDTVLAMLLFRRDKEPVPRRSGVLHQRIPFSCDQVFRRGRDRGPARPTGEVAGRRGLKAARGGRVNQNVAAFPRPPAQSGLHVGGWLLDKGARCRCRGKSRCCSVPCF